jgi:hypothetical protein
MRLQLSDTKWATCQRPGLEPAGAFKPQVELHCWPNCCRSQVLQIVVLIAAEDSQLKIWKWVWANCGVLELVH